VATTRQSADTVGQAFKTLFARIQDLELGETLDDGTTLGAYAEALNKVGINIKDQNGDLKEMDTILDEMGAKWSTLSQDQQVALAENVAGVRQYTQLMALMNNWDFFKENLGVATESEGTLQEQADIYAESWEAAQNRVSAAAQAIYSDLLDEDFFIGFDNLIEKALVGLDSFIDGIGGLKGVLLGLGAIVTKVFSK
jgi:TP901 family phage tail tape measure protein